MTKHFVWVLAGLVGVCLLSGLVRAEEELDLEMEVFFAPEELPPDVVESASKHRQSIFFSPSAITVITREDIRGSGATTFVDLLRRVPGFDVFELKPSYPVVGARGLTDESNNLVLVLVDGMELMKEFTGNAFWSALWFDLDEVERVEVIRGPGSALYGANAFSAVVNITTVHDSPAGGKATFGAGEQGRYRLLGKYHNRFNLGGGVLTYDLALGSDVMYSPSDPSDDLLQISRAYGWMRYRTQAVDLSLHAGILGGTGLYYTHVLDLYLDRGREYWVMAKAGLKLSEMLKLKIQLYFTSGRGPFVPRINMRAMDLWIFDIPEFTVEYPLLDGQLQLDVQLTDDVILIAGTNLRYISLECDFYDPGSFSELRGAGFMHLNWTFFDELQFTGGIRFDGGRRLDEGTALDTAVSPRAALVYQPWPDHAFRLSYGLAFRKPTLYESRAHPKVEVYNPAMPEIVEKMRSQMGNEELVNEQVHSFEAGWRGKFADERLHASVDVFFNIYQDVISFTLDLRTNMGFPDIPDSTLRYENEDAAIHAVGSEAEITFSPARHWKVWGNFSFRKLMSQADDPTPDKDEDQFRVNLGGRYLPDSGLLVDLAVHFVSSYHLTIPDPDNCFDPPVYHEMGNNFLLIGRLGYRVNLSETQMVEGGLTFRTPLGADFREYPGHPMMRTPQSITASDFGGEMITRLIQFYLRWSF